jgi:hypothetical protein
MNNRIIFLVILLVIASCSKKDNCKEVLMSTKQFDTGYGCVNTKYTLKINLINSVTIIRDQTAYDNTVSGVCHPTIDFSAYDLVIGKQSTDNMNDTILYDLRTICPDDELTLTVNIVQKDITGPDTVVYHALIPKLIDNGTLNVSIIIK